MKGVTGLPRARALFGPITEQLANPQSYASRLAKLFAVRNQLNISLGVLGHDLTVAPRSISVYFQSLFPLSLLSLLSNTLD